MFISSIDLFKLMVQTDELVSCHNLMVLYLYDNSLTRIPLLDRNINLAHLYLQNNKIGKIEGLASLSRLTKLQVIFNYFDKVWSFE